MCTVPVNEAEVNVVLDSCACEHNMMWTCSLVLRTNGKLVHVNVTYVKYVKSVKKQTVHVYRSKRARVDNFRDTTNAAL